MKKLVTIIVGSNRPANIKEFVQNLTETATYPEQIEIIFAIDLGDTSCIDAIKDAQTHTKIDLKYLEGYREIGYFEANTHYNNCLHLANKDSYFFINLSDKTAMETQGWDEKLKQYVGYFKDDFFRIRISQFKNFRYNFDLHDALTRPDNFAFHTRKFLELSGGWGDTWGPDTWAQGIVFFCELFEIKDRDIVASDINLKKYVFSDIRGLNRESLIKIIMGPWSFIYLSTSQIALKNFLRIAVKIRLYLNHYHLFKDAGAVGFRYNDNLVTAYAISDKRVIAEMPISETNYSLAQKFINMSKESDIILDSLLTKRLSRRIEKLKSTKKKLKKAILIINIFILKFRLTQKSFLSKFFRLKNKNIEKKESIDFENIIQVKSKSSQFFIEENILIKKAVEKRYNQAVVEAEQSFPSGLIELLQKNHISKEILSFLDNAYVVGLFRKFVKDNNKVSLNAEIPAELYASIGYYLMHTGLQDLAADMFKISLDKKYDDNVAIIYLQNLMYTSPEKYSDERIFDITKKVMNDILSSSDFKEKYTSYSNELKSEKILNIGYTCHFFENETSSNLLLPLLKAHNRDKVKIFIYSDEDPSITKNETKKLADIWHNTYKMPDKEFCELVRKDKIDILLELNGFCLRNRYKAVSTKPAPIQVSFYNLSATSGVEGIDYIISTNDIKLNQNFYSEKIINKEGTYLTISPNIAKISDVPPYMKNGYITFGSFGQIHKVSREQIMLWVEVLKQVDGSKLFLKSSNLHRREIVVVLKKHFEDAGIEFENRTIIEGSSEYSELIRCYERVDIALDTFPYGGGTTSSEAILCGVPLIHLTGKRFCSQHGTNYLRYFNLEELICHSKEEFVQKAVMLAGNKEKITWYRENLPDLARQSKKCDIPGYITELEDVYRRMWNQYIQSQKNL